MQKCLEKLAIDLFNVGAIEFGSFSFKIHEQYPYFPLSPNKINLRMPDNGGSLTLELAARIAWEMQKKMKVSRINFDLVSGLPKAGEPFAECLAQTAKKRLLKLEKENFPDGKRKIGKIIGKEHKKGQSVICLDDVLSQASTKVEGIKQFLDAGLNIAGVFVVVDREEGGEELLSALGCRLFCLYKLSVLFNFYCRSGKITQEQLRQSLAYSRLAKKIFIQNLA